MAITEVKPSSVGASGSASGTDPSKVAYSFTANYIAKGEPGDTCQEVWDYFYSHADLPWFGRVFNFGHGFNATVTCRGVDPSYVKDSGGTFVVACKFESPDTNNQNANQGLDSNGKLTDDPLKWFPQINISYCNITEAAPSGIFRGFVNSTGNKFMQIDKERAITNSADVPYDPPIERENSIEIIRITRNYSEPAPADLTNLRNKVNNDAFEISFSAWNFRRQFRPYFVKMMPVEQENGIENGKRFWRVTKEIQVHPRGWRRQILDKGMHRSQREGDKKDDGQTISISDIIDGWVSHTSVKDLAGEPITVPVPFDGRGQPLKPGDQQVYLTYSIEDEVPFAGVMW